ncbi:hypothetical protein HN481_04415 [Candidatus Parcubacteria bacterium]|nr:hypothetical protein [Candidatus Parcubacteria bacterium]
MRLSSLQQYILLKMSEKGTRMDRKFFRSFYETQEKKPNIKYQEHIITQSLERLIDRGLITGFGKRTTEKWFITHVGLAAKGRDAVQEIHNRRQKKLPLA